MEPEGKQIVITIPLFLKKLWKMVNDKDAEEIIGWNTTGDGFVIYDQIRFVTELLPQYFKHNHLASFVRQLNFYDFHKVANSLKNEIEFAHPYFLKDLPETLAFITRKCPNLKSKASVVKEEDFREVLNGVKELKTKHHIIDSDLQLLKQENTTLWNEINSLRLKYSKQTKIINKLIHFLISYIHSHPDAFPKQNVAVRRKKEAKNLNSSAQLLPIDYLNVKKSQKAPKLKRDSISGSSKAITLPGISTVDIESLLQESDESVDDYTVSYPEKHEEDESSTEYPIEEILSETDHALEETSNYTVKFPKNGILKSEIVSPAASPSAGTCENKKESNQPIIQPIIITPLIEPASLATIQKSEINSTPVDATEKTIKGTNERKPTKHSLPKCTSHTDTRQIPSKISRISQVVKSVEALGASVNNLKSEFSPTSVTNQDQLQIPLQVSETSSEIEPSQPSPQSPNEYVSSDLSFPLHSIKIVPSSSRDLLKYSILENPKEHLSTHLDNTQLQLNGLQEILNTLNAKEISDLANYLILTDDNAESESQSNLNFISKELEDELTQLPIEVSDFKAEASNKQICISPDPPVDNFNTDDLIDEYFK